LSPMPARQSPTSWPSGNSTIRYAGGPVGMRLIRDEALICEVTDISNTQPRLRRARWSDEGGRGLFLVAQLTKRWGSRYAQRARRSGPNNRWLLESRLKRPRTEDDSPTSGQIRHGGHGTGCCGTAGSTGSRVAQPDGHAPPGQDSSGAAHHKRANVV
jgi:hypothetical protein